MTECKAQKTRCRFTRNVFIVGWLIVAAIWEPPVMAQQPHSNAATSLASFALLVRDSPDRAKMQEVFGQDKGKLIISPQDLKNAALKIGIDLQSRRLTLEQLRLRGGPAILRLQNPDEFATVSAIGSQHALIANHVVDAKILAARYTGEALVLSGIKPSLLTDNAVHIVKFSASGGEVSEKVVITNRGRQSVNLEVVDTSCGCTSAELSLKSAAPGQNAVLTIKMKADGWGEKTETATIRTSDPSWPRLVVALQVQMPKSVVPNPSRLTINTSEGQASNRAMTLLLPANASIAKVSTRNPFLTAKLVGSEPIEGGTVQRVELLLAVNAPVGAFTDELTFQLNGAGVPRIGVPIEGTIEPDVTLNPRQLFLGQVRNDSNVLKTVIVQSRSERPFSIKSIESKNPHITAKASPDILAAAHAVEINVAVSGEAGSAMEGILKLTLADGRTLDIPVFGLIAKANEMTTAATSQTAATLQVGKPAPDFAAPDMNGNTVRLADFRGRKNLLLTFFPKCFTGGCAGQLASLQAERKTFNASDTEIIAVSVDPAAEQVAFAARLGLDFPLIPDTTRKLCLLYNAVQTPADLASRMSLLIDKAGIVRLIDRDVQVKTHGADVLAQMRALGLAK